MHTMSYSLATLLAFLTLFIKLGSSLTCWDCNSAMDPRCGQAFDPHTLATVDCSTQKREHLKIEEAQYCRKTIQIIGETTRVIRGCGWLEDSRARSGRCYTRTGTKDVMVTFCQCSEDSCNSSMTLRASLALPILMLLSAKLF